MKIVSLLVAYAALLAWAGWMLEAAEAVALLLVGFLMGATFSALFIAALWKRGSV